MSSEEKRAARKARRAALKQRISDSVAAWREEHSIDGAEGAAIRAELLDVLWAAVPILADGDIDEDDRPALQKLFAELDDLQEAVLEALSD